MFWFKKVNARFKLAKRKKTKTKTKRTKLCFDGQEELDRKA